MGRGFAGGGRGGHLKPLVLCYRLFVLLISDILYIAVLGKSSIIDRFFESYQPSKQLVAAVLHNIEEESPLKCLMTCVKLSQVKRSI